MKPVLIWLVVVALPTTVWLVNRLLRKRARDRASAGQGVRGANERRE